MVTGSGNAPPEQIRQMFKEEMTMKMNKKAVAFAMVSAMLLTSVCGAQAQSYKQGMKNGLLEGAKAGMQNRMVNGAQSGLKKWHD